MTPEVFWELIAELGADHDEVDAFRTALSRRSGEDISAFWDLVVSHAAVLNTDTYRGQTPIEVGDDPEHPLPLGDDAFLDARMAVVAQGREDYDAVVADPTRFGAMWRFEIGEALVGAGGNAYEASTGDPWPALSPDVLTPSGLPPLSRWRWFNVLIFDGYTDATRVPEPYRAHLEYLEHLLNEDRQWWDWWDTTRGPEAELSWQLEPADAAIRRTTIRSGKDSISREEVTVAFRFHRAEYDVPPAAATASLGWATLARDHLNFFILGKLTAKLSLPPTPPLPTTSKNWNASVNAGPQTNSFANSKSKTPRTLGSGAAGANTSGAAAHPRGCRRTPCRHCGRETHGRVASNDCRPSGPIQHRRCRRRCRTARQSRLQRKRDRQRPRDPATFDQTCLGSPPRGVASERPSSNGQVSINRSR